MEALTVAELFELPHFAAWRMGPGPGGEPRQRPTLEREYESGHAPRWSYPQPLQSPERDFDEQDSDLESEILKCTEESDWPSADGPTRGRRKPECR